MLEGTKTTQGAGPHITRYVPSKRIKALHRKSGSKASLRSFVDSTPDINRALASQWFRNKKAK